MGILNMKVSEIITSACLNSQVVPSTNIGDIPGDIYDIALHKLKYDVLGTLNVDRTLDMALTSRVFQPNANKIRLQRDPEEIPLSRYMTGRGPTLDNKNMIPPVVKPKIIDAYKVLGRTGYKLPANFTLQQFINDTKPGIDYTTNFHSFHPTTTPSPQLTIFNAINAMIGMPVVGAFDGIVKVNYTPNAASVWNITQDEYIWSWITSDGYSILLIPTIGFQSVWYLITNSNMRWMPYFVDSVLDEPSGLPHTLLDKSQFHSIDFKFIPWIYTVENGDNWMELEFKSTGNVPKRLTYPIPIYIDGDELVAPPKFHQYIMDCVAEQLAVLYNMSSIATLTEQKNQSYAVLKRQHPNMIQPINTRLQIRNTLQSGQSRWFRFDGFNGG